MKSTPYLLSRELKWPLMAFPLRCTLLRLVKSLAGRQSSLQWCGILELAMIFQIDIIVTGSESDSDHFNLGGVCGCLQKSHWLSLLFAWRTTCEQTIDGCESWELSISRLSVIWEFGGLKSFWASVCHSLRAPPNFQAVCDKIHYQYDQGIKVR